VDRRSGIPAAAQNEQYLELMQTPGFRAAAAAGVRIGWNGDAARLKEALLADEAFRGNVGSAREEYGEALRKRNEIEHCGQAAARPGCGVTVRFLYQVLRGHPPAAGLRADPAWVRGCFC
jgi:adenosine deaminase